MRQLHLDDPVIDIEISSAAILYNYVKVLAAVGKLENLHFFATAKRICNVFENGGLKIGEEGVRNCLAQLKRQGYVGLYGDNPGKYIVSQKGANILRAIQLATENSVPAEFRESPTT